MYYFMTNNLASKIKTVKPMPYTKKGEALEKIQFTCGIFTTKRHFSDNVVNHDNLLDKLLKLLWC